MVKNLPAMIPGSGRFPGEGSGSVFLPGESHGAWQATVHGIAGSDMTNTFASVVATGLITSCE